MSRKSKNTGKSNAELIDELSGRGMKARAITGINQCKQRDTSKIPIKFNKKWYFIDKSIAEDEAKLSAYLNEKLSLEQNSSNNHNEK